MAKAPASLTVTGSKSPESRIKIADEVLSVLKHCIDGTAVEVPSDTA